MSPSHRLSRPWLLAAVAALAAAMILAAVPALRDSTRGLSVTRGAVGRIPVTVFAPAGTQRLPAVVIAHGFAGSQQLMQPLATTLAHAGLLAISFDFPGHGRHSDPLGSGLDDQEAMSDALRDALAAVVADARTHPRGDGRVALLGHSMASDVVVRLGIEDPAITATIAVSLFFPRATDLAPRNLLVIDGALEADELIAQGLATIRGAAGGTPEAGPVYGRFEDGSARRLVLARGAEHIGVLYARDSLDAAVDWLAASFALPAGDGWRDTRGTALLTMIGGLVLLAWPLSRLLPVLREPAQGLALPRRELLIVAGLPALATPLLLWPLPHRWLPLLLGGYLAMHFALYGLLMAALAWRRGHRLPGLAAFDARTVAVIAGVAVALAAAYGTVLDGWVVSVWPHALRLPLVAVMAAALLPYFLIDEWLTRGAQPAAGAYPLTKLLLLVSLSVAVALNLAELFFLIIIVPVILLLFVVFGLASRWIGQRCGQPLVPAVVNALLFGWLIAVSFPVVSR